MALSDDRIAEMMRDTWGCSSIAPRHAAPFARAVEAEVRKQDTELIRQLVASLEGYRRNHNDNQPCDAERAGRAWLDGTKPAAAPTTQPAPQQQGWCDGCSPENCPGCMLLPAKKQP